ncbi:MAG TPA: hypothetical protein VFC29_21465, partial [Candidatus Limnocylindrales bacterium]|nr:hypothetical protein [Candidatus Limnocylindrales bacterium]
CLTKPDGKAVVNSCGTRVGAHRTLRRAQGPAKGNNYALEPRKGYTVWGCWELKRKFRLNKYGAQMAPSTTSKVTTDHDEIRRWAEARNAIPATVVRTKKDEHAEVVGLDFPGFDGEGSLEEISWEQWFNKFDKLNLALLYQEDTAGGEKSNFNKIIRRETAQEVSSAVGGRGRSATLRAPQRQASGGKRSAGTASKKSASGRKQAAGSSSHVAARKVAGDGRAKTAAKSQPARGRASSSGRASTKSRTSETSSDGGEA